MPIDSAASLLFNIGANSDDAEANIQRFRALLGKDLDDLSGEFSDWSTKVFGNLTTVEGAMLGVTAAAAAGIVAVGVAIEKSTNDYVEYVTEVERGSRATGISIEQMNEQQRAAIEAGFAAIRKGLLDKEQQDLQQLWNSQGWRGTFGDEFTQDIRRNEQLMKEWATSSNQSLLMVKVALESMDEMAQKAFQQMAQGMGAGSAHAMIYEKSIGAAMKAALVATLESLAGQAYAHAIYSLALGFLDLAEGNEPGAVAAFEAAALFAAVGTAAALIGRAIGPGGSSGGAGGAGGGSDTSKPSQTSQQASASRDQQLGAVGAPSGASGPHVTVIVQGHVIGTSGVSELCGMLNDAVMSQGNTLTATNTTTGKQVQQ